MTANGQRNLVFISHATPVDNEFTLWLSTRLKLAGYQIWSDVTQLFGGEKFWEDIEEAIADYTCKFVIIITRSSLSKPGVQREIECALAAEQSRQLDNFIIPIIIDDSSFSNQPYGFSDRNIIPFRNGWAEGFSRLLERFSRDNVPKSLDRPVNLGPYISNQTSSQSTLIERSDLTVSNWLNIEHFPNHINFYRLAVKPEKFRERFSNFPYPWFEYSTNFASFCNISDLQKGLSQWESPVADPVLNLEAVLKGEPTNYPGFERYEVVKKLNFVIVNAWAKEMRCKGLHCYTLANGKEAFFFPDEEQYSGQLKFPNMHGEIRRRNLVGYSGKNRVFWHYAVEVKSFFGHQPKVCLMPHVVFTEDGRNPLSDSAKMHRLRRGFCKSWWNARWRDMLLAYLYQLSGGEDSIVLPVGSDSSITLSARPIMLQSPVSILLETESQDVAIDDIDIEVVDVVDEEDEYEFS